MLREREREKNKNEGGGGGGERKADTRFNQNHMPNDLI